MLPGSIDADIAGHARANETSGRQSRHPEKAAPATRSSRRSVAKSATACGAAKFKKLLDGTELDKPAQIADSLRRILEQPHAVWAVKLADRITNLAPPPSKWDRAKCERYQAEAQQILDTLGAGCPPLADRLRARIAAYPALYRKISPLVARRRRPAR